MRELMTNFIKKNEINNNWFMIDATNAVVGRLATIVSKIIRGKNKTTYTPHMDDGDFVVVKNIEKIKFSGNKYQNKKYYKHTGYPGGIKETTPEKLSLKNPEEILKLAVYVFVFSIFARALLSWVSKGHHHPLAHLLGSFTEPLLMPARRLLPTTGGLDLSPIIVFIALMLLLKLLVQPLLDLGRVMI